MKLEEIQQIQISLTETSIGLIEEHYAIPPIKVLQTVLTRLITVVHDPEDITWQMRSFIQDDRFYLLSTPTFSPYRANGVLNHQITPYLKSDGNALKSIVCAMLSPSDVNALLSMPLLSDAGCLALTNLSHSVGDWILKYPLTRVADVHSYSFAHALGGFIIQHDEYRKFTSSLYRQTPTTTKTIKAPWWKFWLSFLRN